MRAIVTVTLSASLIIGALVSCRNDEQQLRGAGSAGIEMPEQQVAVQAAADTAGLPTEGILARVAIGDLAGGVSNTLATTILSPYGGDMAAANEGGALFVGMNCASCHGYTLKGGMGPDLTDTYWRYGGSPAAIYKSIFEGRPEGMPAWGRTLPPTLIWKVVAYIETYGGAFPAGMAERAHQGDLGNRDTSSFSTMKGRQHAR